MSSDVDSSPNSTMDYPDRQAKSLPWVGFLIFEMKVVSMTSQESQVAP